jgi:uroporphyrinogen-III synthase
MLRDAGITVVNVELVGSEVLNDLSGFENVIERLHDRDGVFFTSPVAAQVFVDHVKPALRPILYVLGRRASAVLIEAGFAVKTIPDANTAEEMLSAFGEDEFAGKKLLFVRGEQSMRTIPDTLAGKARMDEVAVYRTIDIEPSGTVASDIRHRLTSGELEWICLFSPSGVEDFEKRFGAVSVKVGTIGETTAARARELGFKVEVVASRAANAVFAAELISKIKERQIV